MDNAFPIQICLDETLGIQRRDEPVSFGVPLPKGLIQDSSCLCLKDRDGTCLNMACQTLLRWPDNSIQWLLVDALVSVEGGGQATVFLCREDNAPLETKALKLSHQDGIIEVSTGKIRLGLGTCSPLLRWIKGEGKCLTDLSSQILFLRDRDGGIMRPIVDRWSVVHDTDLRCSILFTGRFEGPKEQPEFEVVFHFYAGQAFIRMDVTLKNTKPAVHKGGAWDLGDPNTFLFQEFNLNVLSENKGRGELIPEPSGDPVFGQDVAVNQASSGLDNYLSLNHVNRHGKVDHSFKGYQVIRRGKIVGEGGQADPLATWSPDHHTWLSCYVQSFWQNFPKSLSIVPNGIQVGLFPNQMAGEFELQPGEQKTHTLYLAVGHKPGNPLLWARAPLVSRVASDMFCRFAPRGPVELSQAYDELIRPVGEGSFEKKNHMVDEYGWRHYGDVWADHESASSDEPLISHYNNQYDLIKGLALQFLRTGNPRWFRLAMQMADHVADIDIYHTDGDRPEFNRGMFWHTDHHLPACTSTHRTISMAHKSVKPGGSFGGGPAPDHNYTTGLTLLYWMTGELRYKKAVLELAGNIIQCVDSPHTFSELGLKAIKKIVSKIRRSADGSYADIFRYNGPSRVSGNSVNTLLDGFLVSGDRRFMERAEQVIARAVSLEDDFEKMALLDAERRWMYTVFLSALGRYLDVKTDLDEIDEHFSFGREVLLRYAAWMEKRERPYLEKAKSLEFPTETWAAQDIRKADIFAWAACHSKGAERQGYISRCSFFFNHAIEELSCFDSRHFTRPMALAMSNGMKALDVMSKKDCLPKRVHCSIPPVAAPLRGSSSDLLRLLKNFSWGRELHWLCNFFQSR